MYTVLGTREGCVTRTWFVGCARLSVVHVMDIEPTAWLLLAPGLPLVRAVIRPPAARSEPIGPSDHVVFCVHLTFTGGHTAGGIPLLFPPARRIRLGWRTGAEPIAAQSPGQA